MLFRSKELKSLARVYRAPIHETIELTPPSEKLVPSIVQAPKVELVPLPDHLKYVFLGDGKHYR